MPDLLIEGDELVVPMGPWQAFWGFHRTVRVPLSAVRSVSVPEHKWLLRGWRSTGTGLPGVIALGTRRHGTGRDFVAVDRRRDAVQVDLNGASFERLVVSVDDPRRRADEVAAAAGIHR